MVILEHVIDNINMANRTEELEKLVVSQALQLAELHRVAAETTSQSLSQSYLQILNLTEEVRVLKQQLTFSLETINLQKKARGVEAKENNTLRARNCKLSNEKTLETVKYQQELMKTTALKNENDQLRGGATIMDEEDCENPKVRKVSGEKQRVVAILADNYGDFLYCKMQERVELRSRTTYQCIGCLSQLENRNGYDAIVRSESWTRVVRRDGRYNPNSTPDMKEFYAYLNKKTYGF